MFIDFSSVLLSSSIVCQSLCGFCLFIRRLSFVLCTEIFAYLLTENVYGQRSEHGVSAVWTPGLL